MPAKSRRRSKSRKSRKRKEEVSLPHLKLHYFLFYYTKHKKESKKELHVKREEELARRENLVESKYIV